MTEIITLPIAHLHNNIESKDWVAYTLHDASGTVQFVGCCAMDRLMLTPDARKFAMFDRIFPPGAPMTIRVIHKSPHKHDCRNKVYHFLRTNPRPLMMKVFEPHGPRLVLCVETGLAYRNVTQAAQMENVNQGQLSNHLNGNAGAHTVQGKTFKYISAKDVKDEDYIR